MQSLFAAIRTLHTDSTAQTAATTTPADTGLVDGPQVLGADELALVSGGGGEGIALPVTKW